MAVKNHEMDGLIAQAAMQEFLKYGYNEASLRRIAEAAGTTTGSIYMRYKNKDELFSSLTGCIFEESDKAFSTLLPVYQACLTPEDIIQAMEKETQITLNILFGHYDASMLILCKSEGSSVEAEFNELIHRKVQVSEQFFHNFHGSEDLKSAFEILVSVQFEMYRQIFLKGYTKESACRIMDILMTFTNSGWQSLIPGLMNGDKSIVEVYEVSGTRE